MIRMLISIAVLSCPAGAVAEDVPPAQGLDALTSDYDGFFSGPALRFQLPDVVGTPGQGRGDFGPQGPTSLGAFTLLPDGRLCLVSGADAATCGVYVLDGRMRMLVTEGGGRLPFRFELGLGQ